MERTVLMKNFLLKKFFDIRWNCERLGTPIDEPNRLNCAVSEETFSKTEQSLSMMLLTYCKFNLGQFRAFWKKICHASHCRQILFPPTEWGVKQRIVPAWTENLKRDMTEPEMLSKVIRWWEASLQIRSRNQAKPAASLLFEESRGTPLFSLIHRTFRQCLRP